MHARLPLLLAAVAASVATSQARFPDEPRIDTRIVFHNGSDAEVTVEVQQPVYAPTCSLLRTHPELLGTLEWTSPTVLALSPRQNLDPVWSPPESLCTVFRVTTPEAPPQIVFAAEEDFPIRPFPVVYETLDQVGEAVLVLSPDPWTALRPTSPDLLWPDIAPLPDCEDPGPVDWSATAASLDGRIDSLKREAGCTTMVVLGDVSGEVEACGPELPFAVGDPVAVVSDPVGALRIDLADPDAPDEVLSFVLAGRTEGLPLGLAVRAELDATYRCVEQADLACPLVRAGSFEVGFAESPLATLEVDSTVQIELEGHLAEVWVGGIGSSLNANCSDSVDAAVTVWGK